MSKRALLLTVITVVVMMMGMALPVLAEGSTPISGDGVVPELVAGNPDCEDLGYNFGFKIDGWDNASIPTAGYPGYLEFTLTSGNQNGFPTEVTSGPQDNVNTVEIRSQDGIYFDWMSSLGIDAVIVKGGPDSNAYIYIPEDTADTGLSTPGAGPDISHVEFCYDYELTAEKTADAEYTRTYTWTIEKNVDPDSHSGFIGDTFSSDYEVIVDQTVTDSDFKVTGTITVANPTPFTVEFEVDDTVNGTTAVVECPTYELGPGEDTTCTYEADLGDEDPGNGTNTAVITSLNEDVDGATAEDDYEFGDPTNIEGYETVNVSDTVQGDLGETSGDYIFEYSDDFECPTDTSLYVDGVYEFEVPNTATIDETGQSDDANVTVTCYAPVISKDATATYDRSWEWMIDKDGDQTDLTLAVGQVFTVNYTVVVTATPTDDDFEVKGTITVVNPNPDDEMVVALSDVLSDGTVATITPDAECDFDVTDLTVPAGGTATCDYEAEPPNGNSDTNTATATLNGVEFDATDNYEFEIDVETDACIDVVDDQYGVLGQVCAGDLDGDNSYTFDEYPIDISYEECGEYTFVNVASFETNDTATTGSDDHTVVVNVPCDEGCTLTQGYWKTHSEYGPAPYDETWALLPDGADTIFYLSGQTWYKVFWTPPAGNPYYNLAHQYMAAYLNTLNGASTTPAVDAALAAAEDLFETYTPAQVAGLNNKQKKVFIQLASTLDKYNNGLIGPGHCDEDESSNEQSTVRESAYLTSTKLWIDRTSLARPSYGK
jgi:hypothetical protein